jgi:hypothetical protein
LPELVGNKAVEDAAIESVMALELAAGQEPGGPQIHRSSRVRQGDPSQFTLKVLGGEPRPAAGVSAEGGSLDQSPGRLGLPPDRPGTLRICIRASPPAGLRYLEEHDEATIARGSNGIFSFAL